MNWTSIDRHFEESKSQLLHSTSNTKMEYEQNENELLQLKKFQDPAKNPERQSILALLRQFGDQFPTVNMSDTVNNIFTKDCEFFLFNSTETIPPKYCLHPKDLANLYFGMQIKDRIVRETYIDFEKMTAIQLCNYNIVYQDETNPVSEIVAEVFSIKDKKISKYRAFLGQMTPSHGDSDPFEVTRKDRVLAMVKQVNYALSGPHPDLKKFVTMFHENVKYKIWSWDSEKCFVLGKHDFMENFVNMQENFVIKSIVPYEVYTEPQVAVGTYVYHLEGIADKYEGKKYVWLCTSYYVFDDDYKITRVSQQGLLHLEGEVKVSFEVYSREKLDQKIRSLFVEGPTLDLFYGDVFALNCIVYSFGPEGSPSIGYNKGTIIADRLVEWKDKNRKDHPPPSHPSPPNDQGGVRFVEFFVDSSDSSYDVGISINKFDGVLSLSNKNRGSTILLTICKFEQGKIVKAYSFQSPVQIPIPSPFSDSKFDNEVFRTKSTCI